MDKKICKRHLFYVSQHSWENPSIEIEIDTDTNDEWDQVITVRATLELKCHKCGCVVNFSGNSDLVQNIG